MLPIDIAEGLLRIAQGEAISQVVFEHKDEYRAGALHLAEACIGLQHITWGVWRQKIVWDAFLTRDAEGALLDLLFDPELRNL